MKRPIFMLLMLAMILSQPGCAIFRPQEPPYSPKTFLVQKPELENKELAKLIQAIVVISLRNLQRDTFVADGDADYQIVPTVYITAGESSGTSSSGSIISLNGSLGGSQSSGSQSFAGEYVGGILLELIQDGKVLEIALVSQAPESGRLYSYHAISKEAAKILATAMDCKGISKKRR